jgi:hypothetical protein
MAEDPQQRREREFNEHWAAGPRHVAQEHWTAGADPGSPYVDQRRAMFDAMLTEATLRTARWTRLLALATFALAIATAALAVLAVFD